MLIDPAIAFSHPEVDLAMTRMFGSPPEDFYESYYSEFPLEARFEERTSLLNLYPLPFTHSPQSFWRVISRSN